MAAGFDMDFYLDWRWDGVPNGYNMLLRNVDDPLSRKGDKSYFNADSGTPISEFLDEYEPRLREAETADGNFNFITCNHDTARVAPRLSQREIALAYCTLFAMPGVPFLYYGDEIGMRYRALPGKEAATCAPVRAHRCSGVRTTHPEHFTCPILQNRTLGLAM